MTAIFTCVNEFIPVRPFGVTSFTNKANTVAMVRDENRANFFDFFTEK
jgi:hypothetical protein